MRYAYVGCRTTKARNARGKGLACYEIRPDGSWVHTQTLFVAENPSFQCLDRTHTFLYSVHGDLTLISSYRIGPDGSLTHLNTVDLGGKNPVDITVDRDNRHVIVATLQGGRLFTVARREDGSLGEIVAEYAFEGKTPDATSFIHQCIWDQTGDYLFACSQSRGTGYGQLRALRYDHASGRFTQTDRFLSRTWDEPRHVAVHPNNRWLYLCEEKGDKVVFLRFSPEDGSLTPLQERSTLPDTVTGYSDASEVMVSPDGHYVIVSNRYTDLMTTYRIDPHTGYLHTASFASCLGKTPRFFCFGPDGACYVANEDSDTIIKFHLDPQSGVLTPAWPVPLVETGSPVCITFL